MTPDDFTADPTGNLSNADPPVRTIASGIKLLITGTRIAGTACTVRITRGQNGAIHRAVHHAQPGDFLVVNGSGSLRFGPFGNLLAYGCIAQGILGDVMTKVAAMAAREEAIGARIHAGDTTRDTFEPDP